MDEDPTLDHARKFLTLDMLRGVAALVVVEFHASTFLGRPALHHEYLAVDFFFMLSGFVLTFAYQERLDQGWSGAAFMRIRLIRLYPLYFLGLLLGITLRLCDHLFGKPMPAPGSMLILAVSGIIMIPAPVQLAHVSAFAFPFNVPAWSLFFEVGANLLHALLLRRRSWLSLVSVILIAAGSFFCEARIDGHVDVGSHRLEVLPGLARVLLSYCLGMLLYRFWRAHLRLPRISAFVSAPLLLLLLIGPGKSAHGFIYDTVVILLGFPLLLVLSAGSPVSSRLAGAFQTIGLSSYAVYILHVPLVAAYFTVLRQFHSAGSGATTGTLWISAFLPLIFVTALLLDRFYDTPLRHYLARRSPAVRITH